MLRYDGKRWSQDETASKATGGQDLYALWLDAQEQLGCP
jgi:hypothetical protein